MTMVRGVRIVAAPCCGAQYALPNYMSMNFSAFEFWTDGWRDGSIMPNDEGLRRCQCGQFVLLKNLVEIGAADASSLPSLGHVLAAQLPRALPTTPGCQGSGHQSEVVRGPPRQPLLVGQAAQAQTAFVHQTCGQSVHLPTLRANARATTKHGAAQRHPGPPRW